MVLEKTKRLDLKIDLNIDHNKKISFDYPREPVDLLKLEENSMNTVKGFLNGELVCHISLTNKRKYLEISYGCEAIFQKNGYMYELLEFFLQYFFNNTNENEIYALINNNIASRNLLLKSNFELYQNDEHGEWFIYKRK